MTLHPSAHSLTFVDKAQISKLRDFYYMAFYQKQAPWILIYNMMMTTRQGVWSRKREKEKKSVRLFEAGAAETAWESMQRIKELNLNSSKPQEPGCGKKIKRKACRANRREWSFLFFSSPVPHISKEEREDGFQE